MLKIAMISSEAVPFGKTGDVGEGVTALSKELVRLGNQVTLMMPLYGYASILPTGLISPLRLSFAGRQVTYSIVEGLYQGMKLVFIDSPQYFQRGGIYGDTSGVFGDNDERFIFFSRACLEYFRRKGERPDIFHCNDWPSALIPLFLKTHFYHDPLSKTPVLFTLHDITFQGNFPADSFSLLELGQEYFTPETLEFYGCLSFLKAGLLYSDILTTVSHRYAQEIQTEEHGVRLDGVVRTRKDRLFGVLNGIDDQEWNPENDPYIVRNYSANDISGKDYCRKSLISEAGWNPESGWPILAMISRLALQKGLDLIEATINRILDRSIHFIVMGTGGSRYEKFLKDLKDRLPDQVHIVLRRDEEFAHRLLAGADLFLMPSRHEPCGANQMYSLKYGTIPVARAIGGMDDTVQEWNEQTREGTGFKFEPDTPEAFFDAVIKAMKVFENKSDWKKLIQNGMNANFSWRNSALTYMTLYDQAIQLKY